MRQHAPSTVDEAGPSTAPSEASPAGTVGDSSVELFEGLTLSTAQALIQDFLEGSGQLVPVGDTYWSVTKLY